MNGICTPATSTRDLARDSRIRNALLVMLLVALMPAAQLSHRHREVVHPSATVIG